MLVGAAGKKGWRKATAAAILKDELSGSMAARDTAEE